jgi:hypothetical protein
MIETLIENPPPVVDAVIIPEYARPYCDKWGNIKTDPLTIIEESRGTDFVKIYFFKIESSFFYSYQLKIKTVILQKVANINDVPEETEKKARRAARDELTEIMKKQSKNLLKIFLNFDRIYYNQPELF